MLRFDHVGVVFDDLDVEVLRLDGRVVLPDPPEEDPHVLPPLGAVGVGLVRLLEQLLGEFVLS